MDDATYTKLSDSAFQLLMAATGKAQLILSLLCA